MVDFVERDSGLVVPAGMSRSNAPPSGEVATAQDGRDITRGYVDAMPLLQPEDHILQLRGAGDYAVYDEVFRDYQVKAAFDQRKLAVVSREWEVTPGGKRAIDKKAAESIENMLNGVNDHERVAPTQAAAPLLGFDATCAKMLTGLMLGFGVGECLWAKDGREVVLDGIKVRKAARFGWAPDGGLRLKTMRHPQGEALPPRKFWAFSVGADNDDEPYGLGLAHWLYWPVFFKRNGIRFWLIFLEKFGQPTAKGTYPGGSQTTPAEKQRLLQALQAIQTDSAIALPQGMEVELIEAARSGTADYTALYDRMNQAIAKVLLGQTQTIEAAGGQYKSEVQMDVRQDLVKADSDLLCESFNRTVVRWLTDWNYPAAAYPRVFRRIDDEPDLKPLADRDNTIFGMGFKPSLSYIQETYGGEWTEKADPPPNPADAGSSDGGNDPSFADPSTPPTVPDQQLPQLDKGVAPALDDWIGSIRDLVAKSESLEEVRDGLMDLFPGMSLDAYANAMGQAITAADLAGRSDVFDEARSDS